MLYATSIATPTALRGLEAGLAAWRRERKDQERRVSDAILEALKNSNGDAVSLIVSELDIQAVTAVLIAAGNHVSGGIGSNQSASRAIAALEAAFLAEVDELDNGRDDDPVAGGAGNDSGAKCPQCGLGGPEGAICGACFIDRAGATPTLQKPTTTADIIRFRRELRAPSEPTP